MLHFDYSSPYVATVLYLEESRESQLREADGVGMDLKAVHEVFIQLVYHCILQQCQLTDVTVGEVFQKDVYPDCSLFEEKHVRF